MSKARIIFMLIFVVASGIGLVMSIRNVIQADNELTEANEELEASNKDLAYQYGECVFYDRMSVEFCNSHSGGNKGFDLYEKYYGDGSWTYRG